MIITPESYELAPANDARQMESDRPREQCGVVGMIKSNGEEIDASVIMEGLNSLQHRGEEAAGVAVYNGPDRIMVIKDVGLVAEVLGGNKLKGVKSPLAIGQVRYGTVETNNDQQRFGAAQPIYIEGPRGPIALAHNGHLSNIEELCEAYGLNAHDYPTDSHAVTACIAEACLTAEFCDAIVSVLSKAEGAYSLTILGEGMLIGIRDPHGFRPLMLGSLPDDSGYAIASESPSLAVMGADFRREIARGEMVVCSQDGSLVSSYPFPPKPSKLCALEFAYFSASHGDLEGRSIHMVRKRMGELLAKEHPVKADIVMGVPDSGLPASEGFAIAANIPLVAGIVKNRHVSRTFIQPTQRKRIEAADKKYLIVEPEVFDKIVVVVDDSIVRGTTMQNIVRRLKLYGAREVHLRISTPPYKWPCFYGMNTGDPNELIARTVETNAGLCEYFGADSVAYLSLSGLRAATTDAAGRLCTACMDGKYPTKISKLDELSLEKTI